VISWTYQCRGDGCSATVGVVHDAPTAKSVGAQLKKAGWQQCAVDGAVQLRCAACARAVDEMSQLDGLRRWIQDRREAAH